MKSKVAAFIAVASLLGFLVLFGLLMFFPIVQENKELINQALIALIGFCSAGTGYYLGASNNAAPTVPEAKQDKGISDA